MPPKPLTEEKHPSWVDARRVGAQKGIDEKMKDRVLTERAMAESEINQKWSRLKEAPGKPLASGVLEYRTGFYREYERGRIYYNPPSKPFYVYGAIGDKYLVLGAPGSWLGWPTADAKPFEDGAVQTFEHGAIYWWPDTGAIDMGNIVVRYTGLACFGETDWDQGSPGDEPYVIMGVMPVATGEGYSVMTQVYKGVDGGDSREDAIELYRGLPHGMTLGVVLMERDFGDPNKFRKAVDKGVDEAAKGIEVGVGYIPAVGPVLSKLAAEFFKAVGPDIKDFVNEAIDAEDDHIGTTSIEVQPKQMVTLARADRNNFRGILWHIESPLISGHGASYKAYLDIQEMQV